MYGVRHALSSRAAHRSDWSIRRRAGGWDERTDIRESPSDRAAEKQARQDRAWDLWLDCLSERDIARELATPQQTIDGWLTEKRKLSESGQPPESRQHFDVWSFPTADRDAGQQSRTRSWAVMKHLGLSGYDRLVDVVLTNADVMRAAVESIDGLRLLGSPTAHLFTLAADDHAADPVAIRALDTAMRSRGWVHEPQHHPDSLHVTLSNVNTAAAARYPDDLAASVADVRAGRFDVPPPPRGA